MLEALKKKIKLNTNIKVLIIIAAVNFISSIIVCIFLYNIVRNIKIKEYGSRAHNAAKVVSEFVDIPKILKYRNTLEMDEEYKDSVRLLDKIK